MIWAILSILLSVSGVFAETASSDRTGNRKFGTAGYEKGNEKQWSIPARKRRPERASSSSRLAISERVQFTGRLLFDLVGLSHFSRSGWPGRVANTCSPGRREVGVCAPE